MSRRSLYYKYSWVSVPCRGLWFLNKICLKYNIEHPSGFRPLSGFMVSQSAVVDNISTLDLRFPSPVGVYGFSMTHLLMRYTKLRVSVPCRGLWFLNKTLRVLANFLQVSVPCRGLWFLNKLRRETRWLKACFRPLSGFMVSQCYPSRIIVLSSSVSVPCRGLWFLNK